MFGLLKKLFFITTLVIIFIIGGVCFFSNKSKSGINQSPFTIKEKDWGDISPFFTENPSHIAKWKDYGFTYEQTRKCIESGFKPYEFKFVKWLMEHRDSDHGKEADYEKIDWEIILRYDDETLDLLRDDYKEWREIKKKKKKTEEVSLTFTIPVVISNTFVLNKVEKNPPDIEDSKIWVIQVSSHIWNWKRSNNNDCTAVALLINEETDKVGEKLQELVLKNENKSIEFTLEGMIDKKKTRYYRVPIFATCRLKDVKIHSPD